MIVVAFFPACWIGAFRIFIFCHLDFRRGYHLSMLCEHYLPVVTMLFVHLPPTKRTAGLQQGEVKK